MHNDYDIKDTDVAVIGYACRFPESSSPDRFWQNLKAGRDCITRTESKDRRKTYAFGVADDIYGFEPERFGISEMSAKLMDPNQRLMFKLCAEALETGGYSERRKNVRIGLFCSLYEFIYVWKGYLEISDDNAEEQTLRRTFLDGSAASRIAYHMNLTGPCIPIKASCASSLYAVHEAVNALINNECDIAVAGGVNLLENQEYYVNAENTLSLSGYTRPFSKDADGFVPGCGGGAVLLKPLSDSVDDNDYIHAVIKGSAINNDGTEKASYAAPCVKGESRAISDALYLAETEPDDIDYIEAHGTGTQLGDAIEIAALNKIFGQRKHTPLYIGSVKSNIGHLNYAAGIAGFIKTVMMLEHNTIVPSLYSDNVNPELNLDSYGYKLADECIKPERPLNYAGVSAFGVGGNNCHIVLSSYPTALCGTKDEKTGYEIVISSAHRENIRKDCMELAKYLENHRSVPLRDVAYTISARGAMKKYRAAFGAKSIDSFIKMLNQPFITADSGKLPSARKSVWLFPGSNVFSAEDVCSIYNINAEIRELFDDTLNTVRNVCGCDLTGKIADREAVYDPLEASMLTLSVQCVIGELLKKNGVGCDAVLGYSAGEYTAAYFSGVISKTELIRLYYLRNRLLERLPEGKMASILGKPEEFELPEGVYISARNTPSRFMITGLAEDIDRYIAELDEKQVFYSLLPLNRAGHCRIVDGILTDFRAILETTEFRKPVVAYISSAYGRIVSDELMSPDYWINQLRSEVNYCKAAEELDKIGNMVSLEIGIGGQLSYFAKKSVKKRSGKLFLSMISEDITNKGEALITGLAALTAYGLKQPSLHDGRIIYLPPSSFKEKIYNEYAEQKKAAQTEWKKHLVLDGCSDKMGELLSFLRSRGIAEILQYVPCDTGWGSTEELYSAFSEIETEMLKNSGIKCIKENRRLEKALDMLCFAASAEYFRRYGVFSVAGESCTWQELKQRLNVIDEYCPFVMLMLSYLSGGGYICFETVSHAQDLDNADEIRCIKSIADCRGLTDTLSAATESDRNYAPFFEFYADAAVHYPEVLEGKTAGKELLYPNGSYNKLFDVYGKIPEMNKVRLYSSVFAKILEKLASESKRPLKILEIGAGTGLVTWNAAKVIEKYGGDYWFTDIGVSFIEKAKAAAKEYGYEFMEFCKADITEDLREQGIPDNYFDIIISCNVIQATGNMRKSLGNCFRTLKKDGFCVLLQTVDGHHISEMLYGLTPEWWNYYHDPLRKYSPIISRENFRRILEENDFRNIRFFEGNQELLTDTALIFAQKKNDNIQEYPDDIIKIDGYENRYVSEYINKNGTDCETVMPEGWKKRYPSEQKSDDENAECRSVTEKRICSIIEHITGIRIDSINSSIYSYDIDSLCGLMICSQIKNEFNIEYSIKDLLGCTTVKGIADTVDGRLREKIFSAE
ncbi:MAG: acyltransferase domain-containing protein [Ruminococcus sp.]|nr:acyltransferase domain-containing protein [Ruminococcus sp.]